MYLTLLLPWYPLGRWFLFLCSLKFTLVIVVLISEDIEENMAHEGGMFVIKRDGREEKVQLDKITARISKLTEGLDMRFIDPVSQFFYTLLSLSLSSPFGSCFIFGRNPFFSSYIMFIERILRLILIN